MVKDLDVSPSGRLRELDDIGCMALFLASDMARYISCADYSIDGAANAGKARDIPWRNAGIFE